MKLKEAAKKLKNWSLYRFAQEMTGRVSSQAVYKWADGKTPSDENLKKICEVLDCDWSVKLGFFKNDRN